MRLIIRSLFLRCFQMSFVSKKKKLTRFSYFLSFSFFLASFLLLSLSLFSEPPTQPPTPQKERQQKIQRDNNRMLRNLLEVDPSRRAERKKRFSRSEASQNAAGSLNLINRQKQLQKITEENKKLLSRIINCAPTFDRHQFKQREANHKRLLRRMAENSGNRQRPVSARGSNPDRFIMEEMRAGGEKKSRRPKSAGRRRSGGRQALDTVAGNRRPKTAMGMRKKTGRNSNEFQ